MHGNPSCWTLSQAQSPPAPHSFVLDRNDTLVGWSDEIQFDHKFFEAETWPITQERLLHGCCHHVSPLANLQSPNSKKCTNYQKKNVLNF